MYYYTNQTMTLTFRIIYYSEMARTNVSLNYTYIILKSTTKATYVKLMWNVL